MPSLVVDAGNTNVKFGLFQGEQLISAQAVNRATAERKLIQLLRQHAPEHAILSNVGEPLTGMQTSLSAQTDLLVLQRSTPVPIKIMYKSKTLGVDRMALAVAAHALFPEHNMLVISTGTCLTYDFVNARAHYLGGAISPGLHMRLHALHAFTARLPAVKLSSPYNTIGSTTDQAILSGVVNGALHEVNGFIAEYKQTHAKLKVILTGGDASYFDARLKMKIFALPHAALIGLQRILQHNLRAR